MISGHFIHYWRRVIVVLLVVAFLACDVARWMPPVSAQAIMPAAGTRMGLTPAFNPMILKGMKVYAKEPFRFDFILDKGDEAVRREGSLRLVKYFLAALTVPEKDLWVNLSPYEQDRIVPDAFGQTEMGRDLLAQDYLLKQITASLMYPEEGVGKQFWAEIYRQAQAKFGTTDIPVDTFNKVWIMPAKAVVYEKPRASGDPHPQEAVAYVVESRLKVMLESDYVAIENNRLPTRGHVAPFVNVSPSLLPAQATEGTDITKTLIRDIILPVLEKEVNEGQTFAQLRQVYNSLILAAWYKKKVIGSLRQSPLGFYLDQNKVAGVNIDDPKESEKIWGRYVASFKQGAYNYIRDEYDPMTKETIPRKYFAGGALFSALDLAMVSGMDASQTVLQQPLTYLRVRTNGVLLKKVMPSEAAFQEKVRGVLGVQFSNQEIEVRLALSTPNPVIRIDHATAVSDEERAMPEGMAIAADSMGRAALLPNFLDSLNAIKLDAEFTDQIQRIKFNGHSIFSLKDAILMSHKEQKVQRVRFFFELLMYQDKKKEAVFTPIEAVKLAILFGPDRRNGVKAQVTWFVGQDVINHQQFWNIMRRGWIGEIMALIARWQLQRNVLSAHERKLVRWYIINRDTLKLTVDDLENIKKEQEAQRAVLVMPGRLTVMPDTDGQTVDLRNFMDKLETAEKDPVQFKAMLSRMMFGNEKLLEDKFFPRILTSENPFERVLFLIELMEYKNNSNGFIFNLHYAVSLLLVFGPKPRLEMSKWVAWFNNQDALTVPQFYGLLLRKQFSTVKDIIDHVKRLGYRVSSQHIEKMVAAIKAWDFDKKDPWTIIEEGLLADVARDQSPTDPTSATGGIDLAPGMASVESRGDSAGAVFQFDPASLHQMDGAAGLDPVIISMEPMKSVPEFLGLNLATTP